MCWRKTKSSFLTVATPPVPHVVDATVSMLRLVLSICGCKETVIEVDPNTNKLCCIFGIWEKTVTIEHLTEQNSIVAWIK